MKANNSPTEAMHYLIARLGPKHREVLKILSSLAKESAGVVWPGSGESIQQLLARKSGYCYSHLTTSVRELQYWGLLTPVMEMDGQGRFIRGFEITGWKSEAYDHWAVQQLLNQACTETQTDNPDKRDDSWNQQLNILYKKDAEKAEEETELVD